MSSRYARPFRYRQRVMLTDGDQYWVLDMMKVTDAVVSYCRHKMWYEKARLEDKERSHQLDSRQLAVATARLPAFLASQYEDVCQLTDKILENLSFSSRDCG